ncbi:hypothetical protein ACAG39_06280 [Caldicellulosiruptoraceae bacterium PP1]
MKRKIMIILAVAIAITSISAFVVFAKDNREQGDKSAIRSMFDAMRSWIQQAQDNGKITKEETNEWNKHLNDMEKYHEKNGFEGHCGGTNNREGENQSYMPGYGSDMMANFSGNSF